MERNNQTEDPQESKSKWRKVLGGGFVIAVLALIVGILQLSQDYLVNRDQEKAEATKIAILEAQVTLAVEAATVRAEGIIIGPGATDNAERLIEIEKKFEELNNELIIVQSILGTTTLLPTPRINTSTDITSHSESPVSPEIVPNPVASTFGQPEIFGQWKVISFLPKNTTDGDTQIAIVNDHIYIIGPRDKTQFDEVRATTDVFYAPILDNEAIGEWSITTPLPRATRAGDVLVIDNIIYIFGGKAYAEQEDPYNNVIYGIVEDNGKISTWNETTPLPIGLVYPAAVANKENIYVVGGAQWKDKPSEYGKRYHYDSLFQAIIKPDGSLSSWATANIDAPFKGYFSAFTMNDKLYVFAPFANGSYVSEISSEGILGDWKSLGNSLFLSEVWVDGVLYGIDNEGHLASVKINSTGYSDYTQGAAIPREMGILLHNNGVFFLISGDVIYSLK